MLQRETGLSAANVNSAFYFRFAGDTRERAASIYRENIWLRVTSFRFAFLCFAMIM
jgi:hypothetical protein